MKSPSASDVKSSFPQLDSAQATGSDADVRTDSVAKSLTCADEVGRSPMAICQKVISGYRGCRREPSNCFISWPETFRGSLQDVLHSGDEIVIVGCISPAESSFCRLRQRALEGSYRLAIKVQRRSQ